MIGPAYHGRTHRPTGTDPIPGMNSFVGEFITLERPITTLAQNGTSADGTDGAGSPEFDTDATQRTNIGGTFATHAPPVNLNGAALSFSTAANTLISLDVTGWYFIQRYWIITEVGGIASCFFNMSGDGNALGDGGGHDEYVKGTFNENASIRGHMLFLEETETFPYLVNTALTHDGTPHDAYFVISVAYLAAPS